MALGKLILPYFNYMNYANYTIKIVMQNNEQNKLKNNISLHTIMYYTKKYYTNSM